MVDSDPNICPIITSNTKTPTLRNLTNYLTRIFTQACKTAFSLDENFVAQVQWNVTGSSDFTCPTAMKIHNTNAQKSGWSYPSSKEVAQAIIDEVMKLPIENEGIIEELLISQQVPTSSGKVSTKKAKEPPANFYIDINLKTSWIEATAKKVLSEGIVPTTVHTNRKVLVDFSSPNIAKEMHVGHLRSTILGDSICRILEYLDNDVMRINHVGDWGTQFGMLITYLEEVNPDYANNTETHDNIKDLEGFYKAAQKRFESDAEFKKRSQEMTVLLQTGNPDCRKAWEYICQVSRAEYNKIYQRLDIKIKEQGESFYDPYCRELVPLLEEKGVVIEDQGAKVMKIPGEKLPLMVVKSDGGLTYDTTDLAALNYRLNTLNRDWIIYVIGSEQELHLKLLFEAGKILGWHKPPHTRLDHMAFGLMLGPDGKKIKTRTGGNVKLSELLDEAWSHAKAELKTPDTDFTDEYIETASEKLGYSAVKYFDLKQFRASQYKFSYPLMLDPKGNTAVYLFYSYVRICSIYSKVGITEDEIKNLIQNETIVVKEKVERNLLLHLLRFNDVIDDLLEDLTIHKLCDYLYDVAYKFAEFYEKCKIAGDNSRMLITELTKRFMSLSFDLLGLKPIEKI